MRSLTFATSLIVVVAVGLCYHFEIITLEQRPSGKESANSADENRPAADRSAAAASSTAVNTARLDSVADVGSAGSPSARGLLKQSRDSLISHQSIKAQLVQETMVDGRRFRATGTYLQGRDLKLRLEFQLKIDGEAGSLLEVCDGQILWTRQSIVGETRITRRDVRQILDASAGSRGNTDAMLRAEFGLGGLPAVLASLERTVEFTDVHEQQIDGQSFLVLRGELSDQFLSHWKPAPDEPSAPPAYVPDEIRVYLDRDVLFPRRFLYLKRVPGRAALRPIVTLDITEVVLNAAVDDSEFFFVPPDGSFPIDVTNEYLQRRFARR